MLGRAPCKHMLLLLQGWAEGGGEGAGLGPEGCMLLAVHMVPYCRSSGDRFFALLFQSVFMFPGTGQYLGQLCLGSWFFHGVVPG